MDELCPLCLKMGFNKRIKAVQINLDEAVWMCENEECPWPIGHESPKCFLRKVGEKWSKEWEMYKKVQKRIGPIPISTELSLYTPPVTPSSDATSKESTKSDYTCETNISEQMRHVGNILLGNSTPNDSYAPKLSSHRDCIDYDGDKKDANISTALGKNENLRMMDSSLVNRTPPILSSIFDIDGDEALSNKINVMGSRDETKKFEGSSIVSEILDVRAPTRLTDTVLKISPNRENLSKKKEVVTKTVKDDGPIKAIPQIRSISTIIDVQTMDCQKTVKNAKLELPKSVEIEKINSPREIEIPSDSESITSRKQEILDNSGRLRLCTTTINIDGSLPITLSYDPTILEGKPVETNLVTIKNNSDNIVENAPTRLKIYSEAVVGVPVESSKKQFRPPAKRRIASSGKQYEKFSFSALKKFVRESKDRDEKSTNEILSTNSNESGRLEGIGSSKDDKPSIVTNSPESSHIFANDKMSRSSNRLDESKNSKNMDHVDAGMTNDDPVVESLSGVLDDILMEDYQNVTANLNDDWLESFFTSDT